MERLSSPPHSIAPPLKKLSPLLLDQTQIDRYLEDGVLVVDNVLSESELIDCKNGLLESLQIRGIKSFDVNDEESAIAFQKLSSTNGSGGVLDIFHDDDNVNKTAKIFMKIDQKSIRIIYRVPVEYSN